MIGGRVEVQQCLGRMAVQLQCQEQTLRAIAQQQQQTLAVVNKSLSVMQSVQSHSSQTREMLRECYPFLNRQWTGCVVMPPGLATEVQNTARLDMCIIYATL